MKLNNVGKLLVLMLTTLGVPSVSSAEVLRKRVIYGIIMRERQAPAYSVIGYFVWIGFGREILDFLLFTQEWKAERQVCALLTPFLVQSACHCFTNIEKSDRFFQRAVRNNNIMEYVVGHSQVEKSVPFAITSCIRTAVK